MFLLKTRFTQTVCSAVVLFAVATQTMAQADNIVELQYSGGDTAVTGELLEFTNGVYRIKASVGAVTIPSEGIICVGAACPESERASVESNPIKLTSIDGSSAIEGTLVEVKDGFYYVSTEAGTVPVLAEKVNCVGAGCVETVAAFVPGGDVVLTSPDGSAAISGQLLELTDEYYVVASENLGALRVRISSVNCAGAGCPSSE